MRSLNAVTLDLDQKVRKLTAKIETVELGYENGVNLLERKYYDKENNLLCTKKTELSVGEFIREEVTSTIYEIEADKEQFAQAVLVQSQLDIA